MIAWVVISGMPEYRPRRLPPSPLQRHCGGICTTVAPEAHSPRMMVRISVRVASNTCALPGLPPEHGPLSMAYSRPLLSAATAELLGTGSPCPAPRATLLL